MKRPDLRLQILQLRASQGSDAVRTTVEVQGLRDELANLRNEIELQRNQLDKLTQRQRELYDDLDYRLRQQERSSGGYRRWPSLQQGTREISVRATPGRVSAILVPVLQPATVVGGATGQASQGTTGATAAPANSKRTGQTVASIDQGSAAVPQVMVQQDAIATPKNRWHTTRRSIC